jgi:hypothetical protein
MNFGSFKQMMGSKDDHAEDNYETRAYKYSKLENNPLIAKIQNRGVSNHIVKSMDHQGDDYHTNLVVIDSARNQLYSSPQSIT